MVMPFRKRYPAISPLERNARYSEYSARETAPGWVYGWLMPAPGTDWHLENLNGVLSVPRRSYVSFAGMLEDCPGGLVRRQSHNV